MGFRDCFDYKFDHIRRWLWPTITFICRYCKRNCFLFFLCITYSVYECCAPYAVRLPQKLMLANSTNVIFSFAYYMMENDLLSFLSFILFLMRFVLVIRLFNKLQTHDMKWTERKKKKIMIWWMHISLSLVSLVDELFYYFQWDR